MLYTSIHRFTTRICNVDLEDVTLIGGIDHVNKLLLIDVVALKLAWNHE